MPCISKCELGSMLYLVNVVKMGEGTSDGIQPLRTYTEQILL
jgi:hypothetical protein